MSAKFARSGKPVPIGDPDVESILGDIYIRELAFWSCVNIIANAICKCEFKTIHSGKEIRGDEHYLWNVEPNSNQSASNFRLKMISKLYSENEALIFSCRNRLYIADSFDVERNLRGNRYNQIVVDDEIFARTFDVGEVIHLKLGEHSVRTLINGMYSVYAKIITTSIRSYQKNSGTKAVFSYESLPVNPEERTTFDELVSSRMQKFLQADNAIIPMGKGQTLTEYSAKTNQRRETSRDIRATIDDVSDFTAKALLIPPSLVRGDVQDTKATIDQFLTFCIDPLTKAISDEINRKRYGKEGVQNGRYILIDTKSIKHVDLFSVSTSIDKLISSGTFCINDIRKLCGESEIDAPWARQHFITKNYQLAEQSTQALEEGQD